LHKHVELTADGCRTVSRQAIEIVHHVHLIVISQSMGKQWVGMKNIGKDSISLVFIFSAPGFEDNMRCGSVLAGQSAPPITTDELSACAHAGHVEFEAFASAAKK
jgi:hypothetical protein